MCVWVLFRLQIESPIRSEKGLHFSQDVHINEMTAVDKTRIGSDRIGSDGTDKTLIGSDRVHKTWIGSNSIKETHIYSLKVGAFQIPTKNGQVVSLDQDDEERSRKWLPVHCFCFFSSILPWRLFVYCYAYGFTPCKVLHEKNFFLEGEI